MSGRSRPQEGLVARQDSSRLPGVLTRSAHLLLSQQMLSFRDRAVPCGQRPPPSTVRRTCSGPSDQHSPASSVSSGTCFHLPAFSCAYCPPYHRKTPWKLSRTRKANVRSRLKQVDSVIEAVRSSGVECAALVRTPLLLIFSYLTWLWVEDQGTGVAEGARDAPTRQVHRILATRKGVPQGHPQGSKVD